MTVARHCSSILALAMAIATLTPSVAAAGAAPGTHRISIVDVCPEALPWTDDAPLSLPARKPRDEQGVPMIIVDGQRYYRPGALAINGMKRLDAFRDDGDPRQLQQALLQAERLRELALHRRGADWLPFWYDYPEAGQRAPWFNAMVQGLALSFYVRLGRVTGDPVHLVAARGVFRSFQRQDRDRTPWVAYVDGAGHLWLEHYPRRRPDHVLNAHLFALFGIYEYWQVTRSVAVRSVLRDAIRTMQQNAGRYRRPGGLSRYDLVNGTTSPKYHAVHIWQLGLLADISGDRSFARLARQLADDHPPSAAAPGRPAERDGRFSGRQTTSDMTATHATANGHASVSRPARESAPGGQGSHTAVPSVQALDG
jgi:hypothetical protein